MNAKFSKKVNKILANSKEQAIRLGNAYVGTEHIFLAILQDGRAEILQILIQLGFNLDTLQLSIEHKVKTNEVLSHDPPENIPIMKSAERVISLVELEAKKLKAESIDLNHFVLAILRANSGLVAAILNEHDADYETVKNAFVNLPTSGPNDLDDDEFDDEDAYHESMQKNKMQKKNTDSDTPVLDNFGTDLTKAASQNKLDPIIGRDNEIERLVQILSRRKKNNPVLIGEPGVGKSAIAEGLALRIINNKVSRVLFGKRIVTLDIASVVAGTKYRGQFEERMKSILKELSNNKDVILFIDEIHTLIGAGGASGSLDASNMMKPALARGEIQCIGATTLDEYRQNIEKDGALERRFQKIMVEPTTEEETTQILNNIKEKYEEYHNVFYTDDAINACVKLTTRYISDRHLPDKAIDALDETGSRVHISKITVPEEVTKLEAEIEQINVDKLAAVKNQQFEKAASFRDKEQKLSRALDEAKDRWNKGLKDNKEEVSEADVEKVVAMMTGVPVQRIAQAEGARLLKMKEKMTEKVIGQDEAVGKIVKSIQRNRAGLKDPNKPIGTFIFLGPTGVGKTHLAKILAEYMFDTQDSLIRIDMSEYMEKFSISRLVGAPPGYVGYEEGGQLTEKVRRKPYSIILLDEIEKAHPDVFHILLQVLDEGRLTDSLGRHIDFKNTILIMTSNVGAREISDFGEGVGFSSSKRESSANTTLRKALKKTFAPEFLNRIDDVILFKSLSKESIYTIIDIELEGLYGRVRELGFDIHITQEAKKFIADKGLDTKFGARPLKRAIQKYVEDEMAEVIIEAKVTEGDTIMVALKDDKTGINISIDNSKTDATNNSKE